MAKALFIIGGVINCFFVLFHILLGFQIHRMTEVAPAYRGLMEALNSGGALFILFFAIASLFLRHDMLETALGHTVLGLATALYLSRAVQEFVLFRGDVMVFFACVVTGAIYGALLIISLKQRAIKPVSRSAAV